MRHSPPHDPINEDDGQHDTGPFARVSSPVPILLQYSLAINLALSRQCTLVHTVASFAAVILSVAEFVDHHASKDVRLLRGVRSSQSEDTRLTHIVNIMKDVSPEWIQNLWGDQKASHTHPQTVCEGDESQSDDEYGED